MRRLEHVWRRVVRALSYVPLRLPGLVLLGGGLAAALLVGRKQADHLLYPAGVAAVGLVAVCAVFVSLAALALRRAVRRAPAGVPESVETHAATRTGFRFPRLAVWPIVEVRMRWDDPVSVDVELATEGRFFEETITAHERGRHAEIVRRFTVEDVFGLCAVSFGVAAPGPMRVAPLIAFAGAELASSHSHGDAFSHPAGRAEGDLVEMRAYGHGDPLRHVLWKTFARTRRLLVRMPERAIAPRPVTVAALVAGRGDEPTAAVARLYIEKNYFGPDFIFAADGAAQPTGKTHEAVDQIIDSVRARRAGGTTLDTLTTQVERTRLGACVIFAPPVDGPWRDRVLAFSRGLPSPATVVIGIEGAAGERTSLMRRLLVGADGHGRDADVARAHAGLPALREALESAGLRVQVVHRQTGQIS